MNTHSENFILFLEIVKMAAFFYESDDTLVNFLEDLESELPEIDEIYSRSSQAQIRLTLLHKENKIINQKIERQNDPEEAAQLELKREIIHEKIPSVFAEIRSPDELKAEEIRISGTRKAQVVFGVIREAVKNRKITLQTRGGLPLNYDILFRDDDSLFLPESSIVECVVDGQVIRDFVCGNRKEIHDWLIKNDVEKGKYDTSEKRIIRCGIRYRESLTEPKLAKLSKNDRSKVLKDDIPGLTKKEFYYVRGQVKQEFPYIAERGRRK